MSPLGQFVKKGGSVPATPPANIIVANSQNQSPVGTVGQSFGIILVIQEVHMLHIDAAHNGDTDQKGPAVFPG
jgi:hypothetical protein